MPSDAVSASTARSCAGEVTGESNAGSASPQAIWKRGSAAVCSAVSRLALDRRGVRAVSRIDRRHPARMPEAVFRRGAGCRGDVAIFRHGAGRIVAPGGARRREATRTVDGERWNGARVDVIGGRHRRRRTLDSVGAFGAVTAARRVALLASWLFVVDGRLLGRALGRRRRCLGGVRRRGLRFDRRRVVDLGAVGSGVGVRRLRRRRRRGLRRFGAVSPQQLGEAIRCRRGRRRRLVRGRGSGLNDRRTDERSRRAGAARRTGVTATLTGSAPGRAP